MEKKHVEENKNKSVISKRKMQHWGKHITENKKIFARLDDGSSYQIKKRIFGLEESLIDFSPTAEISSI